MTTATPIPNPFDHIPGFKCFACNPGHETGLRLRFFARGEEVFAKFTPRSDLTGMPNLLHGGIQSTLLDEVMWWAAFHVTQRICLTQTMTTNLLAPVWLKKPLEVRAWATKQSDRQVWTEGEVRVGEKLLVTGSGVYFLPSERLLARTLGMTAASLPAELTPYLAPADRTQA